MADNKEKEPKEQLNVNIDASEVAPKQSKFKTFLMKMKKMIKIVFVIVLFLCLIVGGFFLGVYLRVFDVNTVNEKLELYKYPILSEYFVKPDNVIDDQASVKEEPNDEKEKSEQKKNQTVAKLDKAVTDSGKAVTLTKEEIDKQIKKQQVEEKKRIGKLARLYEQMKPEDAVEILNGLNDDMIIAILSKMDESQVSKILVKFDTDRSARLTKIMYNGKPPVSQIR